ncbi:LIM and SH3 domain protein 1-like [Takifugu flavidus]|uniref:LIM and SH3 domain protein 1-like n=1 Tax=Takifugu flavidus TaxID=433684 RepID=UPI002544B432|nr:LIM and SH3 domain protein 1-like [Takifugu flavidus]
MNPKCSRCDRIVYPTERLNCLDKCWHRGCFSCEVCKMTLNMKNYKGFEKRPYCNAHYPKTHFTAVADTPENLRLKKQSQIQSQIYYKEDFEKNKGKATQVVDTPEFLRLKKSQQQISDIKYHEDMSKRMVDDAPPPGIHNQADYQPPASSQTYQYDPAPAPVHQPYEPAPAPVPQAGAPPPSSTGKRCRAMYDYTAADDDEVSFLDGDVIVDVHLIDEGWMFGRVERTGQQGMLPANYVNNI